MASRNSSPLLHPAEEELDLFAIMSALCDPVRLTIVASLDGRPERSCTSFDLPRAKSAVSRHCRVLREAGLIRQHDEGTRRVSTLRREEIDRRFPGLLDLILREGEHKMVPLQDIRSTPKPGEQTTAG
jgi:DNA-binding transcriptional ArsR family regulator